MMLLDACCPLALWRCKRPFFCQLWTGRLQLLCLLQIVIAGWASYVRFLQLVRLPLGHRLDGTAIFLSLSHST